MRPVTDLQRTVAPLEVVSEYQPAGDQPTAIADLTARLQAGEKDIVLLGATGTGKSATTAWLIEQVQRPTIVMAPNKDRKSTRLNSSHVAISYAVFCLKIKIDILIW